MTDQAQIFSHEPINIVLTIENGKVIHVRPVRSEEIIASLDTFLWMAERAGYTIKRPAGEKGNGYDSDTNS